MAIDEIIKHLPAPECGSTVIDSEKQKEYEAHDSAVIILRKYQKIKEQVDIAIDKENFVISDARLIQIREIINGNDD